MISRLLLPGFASGAPRDVLLRTAISAHPGQADHVQCAVCLPVATAALRRWRTTLPEEASMGETPQRLAKEASLLKRSGLSPTTTKSVAALSVPMPGKQISSGAACATSLP